MSGPTNHKAPPASDALEEVLNQRGSRYGDADVQFGCAQKLKEALRSTPGWSDLTRTHKEGLEMICTKMSRIVAGDADYPDNWFDIKGYADVVMSHNAEFDDVTSALNTLGAAGFTMSQTELAMVNEALASTSIKED